MAPAGVWRPAPQDPSYLHHHAAGPMHRPGQGDHPHGPPRLLAAPAWFPGAAGPTISTSVSLGGTLYAAPAGPPRLAPPLGPSVCGRNGRRQNATVKAGDERDEAEEEVLRKRNSTHTHSKARTDARTHTHAHKRAHTDAGTHACTHTQRRKHNSTHSHPVQSVSFQGRHKNRISGLTTDRGSKLGVSLPSQRGHVCNHNRNNYLEIRFGGYG